MKKKLKDAPPTPSNETPFQRFKRLTKKVVTVPKPRVEKESEDGKIS